MPRCSPPKSRGVKSYTRAPPRKKRAGLAAGTNYYTVENASGHSCGHQHRSFTAAANCMRRENRKAHRKGGPKAATYVPVKKRA